MLPTGLRSAPVIFFHTAFAVAQHPSPPRPLEHLCSELRGRRFYWAGSSYGEYSVVGFILLFYGDCFMVDLCLTCICCLHYSACYICTRTAGLKRLCRDEDDTQCLSISSLSWLGKVEIKRLNLHVMFLYATIIEIERGVAFQPYRNSDAANRRVVVRKRT